MRLVKRRAAVPVANPEERQTVPETAAEILTLPSAMPELASRKRLGNVASRRILTGRATSSGEMAEWPKAAVC